MMITYVTLKVTHKAMTDLCEHIAQRAYTLPAVDDVDVMACFPAIKESEHECANGHAHKECA